MIILGDYKFYLVLLSLLLITYKLCLDYAKKYKLNRIDKYIYEE